MTSSPSPQSFRLDRNVFNDELYTHIRSTWFAGLPTGAKLMNDVTAKRWWGKGATQEARAAFDEECRTHYAPALESISPERLTLPPFESYATDLAQAHTLSAPFLDAVKEDNKRGPEQGAMTLLSLSLLLDQISRNIYRDVEGLRLVYGHYDRLAWTLLQASSQLDPDPRRHPFFRGRPTYSLWLSLPLMHAEDLASQDASCEHFTRLKKEALDDGDEETANSEEVNGGMQFAKKHRDIIERFGRFPHRHECLGREYTEEERKFLNQGGDTFGVRQGQR